MLDPVLVSVFLRCLHLRWDSHLTHDAGCGFLVEFGPFGPHRETTMLSAHDVVGDGVSATSRHRDRTSS